MIFDTTGRYIKDTNRDRLSEYYYLYEYSDSISVISDNSQYPSLINYVKTGLLTEKEMLEALQYKLGK